MVDELYGNIVNVMTAEIYPGCVRFDNGVITEVEALEELPEETEAERYLLPGFIDGHIHIESSMLCPSRFAAAVVPQGTTTVVSDPHEIANVLGIDGIAYMREDASRVPLRVAFTAPSCVPATPFETAGATLGHEAIEALLAANDMVALGEMMNYPGVVHDDPEVLAKLDAAKHANKPIDGHAPLLSGADLCKYIAAGISTDHECSTFDEALEKARLGMRIQMREGSAAKNLEALIGLAEHCDCLMVSDDKHPGELVHGHLNATVKKARALGLDLFSALRMVTILPARHYGLNGGALAPGRDADIIVVSDLDELTPREVYIGGERVAVDGEPTFSAKPLTLKNTIELEGTDPSRFRIAAPQNAQEERIEVRVIHAEGSQLVTKATTAALPVRDGALLPDVDADVLELAVVERYGGGNIGLGFVEGFGLEHGALASTVAHDSHNIVTVGTTDEDIALAVKTVADLGGGLVAVERTAEGVKKTTVPLPVAGLMSTDPVERVAAQLDTLHNHTRALGCTMGSPFMTLSFLALLVIPELKLSDRGLFDGTQFSFVDLFLEEAE